MKRLIQPLAMLCLAFFLGSMITATGNTTNSISAGVITNGCLGIAETNWYTFSAVSNDVIFLTLLRTNGSGLPYLYLYDSSNTLVYAHWDTSSYANFRNLRLTKTDIYTLAITDDGFDQSFDYLISFNLAKCGPNQRETNDGPETLTPGQFSYGHIEPADYDTFCFTASSNDVIFLTVLNPSASGLPYLYLYDSSGNIVFQGYNTATYANIRNLRLTKTDIYTLAITDDGFDQSFDYLISFNLAKCGPNQRETNDGPETLTPGQFSYGHIEPADYDTFCFTASSNDVIFLTVLNPSASGLPYLYLYDSSGNIVFQGYNTATYANIRNLRLTKTDIYTLAITDDGFDQSFDYTVCMVKNPGPNFPDPGDDPSVISPSQTLTAQITPGDLDAFAFYAIAGDTITIDVRKTSGPGLNPAVQLWAPDGTVLVTASSPTSARIRSECVPQTGTYQAVVFDNGLNEAFGYTISLSRTPIVPPSDGTNYFLTMYMCAKDVVFRWETNAAGFILESTFALPATNWFPVDHLPQIIADHYYVYEGPATNQAQFFRLRCTNCVPGGFAP